MFGAYKKILERYGRNNDWWTRHFLALNEIPRESVRNFFRHCHIPVLDLQVVEENKRMRERKRKREVIAALLLAVVDDE